MFLVAVDIPYEGICHYWFSTEEEALRHVKHEIKRGWWNFEDVSVYEVARSIDIEVD